MAAMKREKQYDMFDVAIGVCDLDTYLNQRYSENDLSSKFWIEKTDEVDELRPPPPGSDSPEPLVIPIQGPRAPKPSPETVPKLEEEAPQEGRVSEPGSPSEMRTAPAALPAAGSDELVAPPEAKNVESAVASVSPDAPSLETVALGGTPAQSPRLEHFEAASRPTPPVPEGDNAQLGLQQPQGSPNPISMEALLAQFHEATKAYEKKLQETESEPKPPES